MKVLVYATDDDLAEWMGLDDPPAGAALLLRSASFLVTRAAQTAVYDVDSDGAPTDDGVIEAFQQATCSHAAAMAGAGVDPTGGPAADPGAISSTGLGSASVSYSLPADAGAARRVLFTQLCPEAFGILAEAGLTGCEAAPL